MSDKLVTVMTFNNSFEAQLAKNLLENDGIVSVVTGELSSDVLLGTGLACQQITLQVHGDDAQRAVALLAEVSLNKDWEDEAESGSDVWVCSICGEPISNRLSICYSCQTPRESIRAAAPRDRTAIQPNIAILPTGKDVQKRDEIAETPMPEVSPLPSLSAPAPADEDVIEQSPTARGDDLARKAFLASLFSVVMPVLMPVAWICLLRLILFGSEMSTKGSRHYCAALLINGSIVTLVLFLCAGGWRFF